MAVINGTNGLIQSYDYQALTTGFSYTFAAGTQVLVANPATTLATGTITMPASPADGMTITISTTQQITALTLNGNSGQSIGGTQTTLLPANSAMQFVYRLSNTTWYKVTNAAIGNVGTAPLYACRAWVNFNGTNTVAIRASGNVSSITDNALGQYTVNFTIAMPDTDYCAVATCHHHSGVTTKGTIAGRTPPQQSGVDFYVTADSMYDPTHVYVAIFR